MSGETEKNVSGWSVDTLNYYFANQIKCLKEESALTKAEVDRHFQLKLERIAALESKLDDHLSSLQSQMNMRFASVEYFNTEMRKVTQDAIDKAERSTELRFASVNEFRAALAEQSQTFLRSATFEESQKAVSGWREAMGARIDQLNTRMNIREGQQIGAQEVKGDSRSTWATVIAVCAVVVSLLVAFVPRVAQTGSTPYIPPPGYKVVPNTP